MPPIQELLSRHPLPDPGGDKHERGTVLVVGGPATCPGAALLAGTSALRTGAGRIQLAMDRTVAAAAAVAFPEALVVGVDLHEPLPAAVLDRAAGAGAVLLGAGLGDDVDEAAVVGAAAALKDALGDRPLLLDAGALVPGALRFADALLPNEHEARRLAADQGDVEPVARARALAADHGCIVAVRGEVTAVTAPADGCWTSEPASGEALGTAGSGDVLAGCAAALAARDMELLAAVGWAVAIHAATGEGVGFGCLARELAAAIPGAAERVAARTNGATRG